MKKNKLYIVVIFKIIHNMFYLHKKICFSLSVLTNVDVTQRPQENTLNLTKSLIIKNKKEYIAVDLLEDYKLCKITSIKEDCIKI